MSEPAQGAKHERARRARRGGREPDPSVREWLDHLDARLQRHGLAQPRLLAELLCADVLGCSRLDLYALESGVPASARERITAQAARVANGEPIQYVQGYTEFMGHRIRTDPRALIPRPETEVLVETVLECKSLWQQRTPTLVDVGTGTGCIAISLARARQAAHYLATDNSRRALDLARENLAQHGLGKKIRLLAGDLLEFARQSAADAVVSNPPYVKTRDLDTLATEIRCHEPSRALDGGPDGLAHIRALVSQARTVLRRPGWLFLEIGAEQGNAVRALMRAAGFEDATIREDLAGRERVAWGRLDGAARRPTRRSGRGRHEP